MAEASRCCRTVLTCEAIFEDDELTETKLFLRLRFPEIKTSFAFLSIELQIVAIVNYYMSCYCNPNNKDEKII